MPLTSFICPDGQCFPLTECLASCRLGRRCLSLPTLRYAAMTRPWTRQPSVTQLLNGTMMEWLRLTQNYAIRPESRAFALLGIRHHEALAGMAFDVDAISEKSFGQDGSYIGHPDYLEPVVDGWTLWDYKTWGSYRVARHLGLVAEKVPSPDGAVYEKSGSWGHRGDPKMVPIWTPNPLVADTVDVDLQFNAYRMLVERHGYLVADMRLQITVRDGGLAMAKSRGIDKLIYVLDVARMDDTDVVAYFAGKRAALSQALSDSWTQPCSPDERWDDERCRHYCDVASFCPHWQTNLGVVAGDY